MKVISFEHIFSVVTICWIILLLYWLVSSFFVKRSAIPRGRWWIIWRVVAVLTAILLIRFDKSGSQYFVSLFRLFFQSSFSLIIPGSVLTIFGLLGAIWARAYLGRNWSGYATYKEHQELVTTGPYRFVRHPIYTSMMLMFLGTILYYGSLFISIIFVVVAISFILRVKKEEEIMIKLFGKQYAGYMNRTKRWIPWIY
jgi:protein-S-isoprenylcysteine O-methyltransferase Ste14